MQKPPTGLAIERSPIGLLGLEQQSKGEQMSIELEDFVLPEHISYSAFTTYLTCGHQYYLGRLLGKQEEPSVWSVGGTSFHLACERFDLEYR